MYAVIRDGSRQHIVRPGDEIELDLRDLPEGADIDIDDVLLVVDEDDVRVGAPRVADAHVKGVVLGEVKGEKLVVFKYKKRKNKHRKIGHRQRYMRIRINEIVCS